MHKQLELEHLVAVRAAGIGNWCAKGCHVAFLWAGRDGQPQLWACSASGGWPRRLTDQPLVVEMGDLPDGRDTWGGPQWSPTAHQIAFLSPASRSGNVSLWTVGLDGEPAVERTRHVASDRTPRWSPDGTRLAFVGNRDGRDDIQVIATTGRNALQLTYDRWDNIEPDWSPDGRWLVYASQRSETDVFANNLFKVPSDGGRPVRLTNDDSANDRAPHWSPDGRRIAFISNRADNDDIWLIDADGNELRQLTGGRGDKGDPRWSPDGRWLAYTHFHGGNVDIAVIAVAGGEPRYLTQGGVNDCPRWSPDGQQLLYRRAGAGLPDDLWIKPTSAPAGEPGRQLTHSQLDLLHDMAFAEPEVVCYLSADGLEIEGLLYHPRIRSARRGPAILWVHGGPNSFHANGWEPLIQYFVQRGYTVFAPNYRGSTGYGKAFLEANVGDKAGGDIQDWVAAADVLRSQPHVDPQRVAIMGRSAGGYAALMCLGLVPDVFQAGVAIAAPSHWFSYWEETEIASTPRLRVKLMGLLSANQALFRRRAPITHAAAFQAPVLIMHGDADFGVPSGQAREMAAELKRLGKVHECYIYLGEAHTLTGIEAVQDSTRRIEAFLEQHLGSGVA